MATPPVPFFVLRASDDLDDLAGFEAARADLEALDLGEMDDLVVIPGRAFVHDRDAERILTSDGKERTVLRGPEMLTADAETSMGMGRDGVLLMELEGFAGLITLINRYGHSAP